MDAGDMGAGDTSRTGTIEATSEPVHLRDPSVVITERTQSRWRTWAGAEPAPVDTLSRLVLATAVLATVLIWNRSLWAVLAVPSTVLNLSARRTARSAGFLPRNLPLTAALVLVVAGSVAVILTRVLP